MTETTYCQLPSHRATALAITFAPTCGMFAGRKGRNAETHWLGACDRTEDEILDDMVDSQAAAFERSVERQASAAQVW